MHVTNWLLLGFIQAAVDTSRKNRITQGECEKPNDISSMLGESSRYNACYPFEPQREIAENGSLASTYKLDTTILLLQIQQQEEKPNSSYTATHISADGSDTPFDHQESHHSTQEFVTGNYLLKKGIPSEEFRAQMARDVLFLKNAPPPSYTALNETLALMNRRVILPSAEIVHWFHTKCSAGVALRELLAVPYRKCALNYHSVFEHVREQNEKVLFRNLVPFIHDRAGKLTDNEANMLAQHRRHIRLFAKHTIDSTTGIITEHLTENDENYAEPPVFDYSVFNPSTQPLLCVCLSVQLLLSGFFDCIPDSFIPFLQNMSASEGATLVSYMLGPGNTEVFSEFITAFYIIWSGMCTDVKSPKLLACHRDIISCLPSSMRFLYWKELAAQLSHLSHLVADCYPALRALGIRELAGEDSILQAATEKISVYWHALSALAMLSTPIPKNGIVDGLSAVTVHTALADYFVQFLAPPVASTASLSCWTAVLAALTYSMPSIDVYAFMVARTPPPFAGPLLHYAVVSSTAYVIIVSLWLVLKTPHADSILANLDAMCSAPVHRYKIQLLMRLPVCLFARASPVLLRQICRILFEQERAHVQKLQENASLKRQMDSLPVVARFVNKRSRGMPQRKAGAISSNGDLQYSSDESTEDETAQTSPTETRKKREWPVKNQQVLCILNAHKDCKQPPGRAASIRGLKTSLDRLSWNLYIHCRTPDDITDMELARLVSKKAGLLFLTNQCCKIIDGTPDIYSLTKIGYLGSPYAEILKELLRIFGASSHPAIPVCANISSTESSACKHRRGETSDAGVSKASTRNFDETGRSNPEEPNRTSRASHAGTADSHDISWDMYANCRHCITTLPAFFARQLLPCLVDLVCASSRQVDNIKLYKLIGHILDSDKLASSMRLLEKALSDVAADLQWLHRGSLTPPLTPAQSAMPQFVLRNNHAIRLSLKDMELRIQRCVPSTFLDARAYMEISDALQRFVFQMLCARSVTHVKFKSFSLLRRLFIQIVRLLPRECPLVYQAAGSVEQAQIKCTWSPVFRASPSRVSPTVIPDIMVINAIKSTCHCCSYALSTNAKVEEWLELFTWLFTRSAVQSLIASPAILLSAQNERALAAVIAGRLEDIASLIARIAAYKANKVADVASDHSSGERPARVDSNRETLYCSLKTKLIEFSSVFSVSKRAIN